MKHQRMTKLAGIASIALLLAGCGGWSPARFTRTDTLTTNHVNASALDIEVANGSVSVGPASGDVVTIEAVIKALTQERLDGTHVVVSRQPDQTLNIRVDWPESGRKSNEGCSLTIGMPDAGAIALTSSNGRLEVGGVGSDVRLKTSNGRITVHGISGSVTARSSNGAIEVRDVPGTVAVETSNGALQLTGIGGPIDGSTSNGAIEVRLADGNAGPVDASTSNGGIRIDLGSAFVGELSLTTSNGKVRVEGASGAEVVELGKNGARLRFGDELGNRSRARTSNGSITVTRLADG